MGYEIVSFRLEGGACIRVLSSAGRPSFIEELMGSSKGRERAALIARYAEKVSRRGSGWARASKVLRSITNTPLFELRVPGRTIRVMACIPDGLGPVYLFDFDGHKGKGGGIQKSVLDRARAREKRVRECIGED